MYSSPIEKIYSELQTQMVQEDENMVMKAVREVGITVDKEELINALQYDRKQYTKGYSDGKSDTLDKISAEIVREKQKINFKRLDDYERAQAEMRLSTLNELLQIIDKYKAEGSDKE